MENRETRFFVMASFDKNELIRVLNRIGIADGVHVAVTCNPGDYRSAFAGSVVCCLGSFTVEGSSACNLRYDHNGSDGLVKAIAYKFCNELYQKGGRNRGS